MQFVWPWGAQWLVQVNLLAWLQGGRMHQVSALPASYSGDAVPPGYVLISDTRALLTLAAIAGIAMVAGWVFFLRRDVE